LAAGSGAAFVVTLGYILTRRRPQLRDPAQVESNPRASVELPLSGSN
jgi:hypothetical protein